jgi:glycosyltransferase involved in cell wall biosynthesis
MTSDCPIVSVIVPVYNSEPYLEDCLQSVIQQTYRSIEIIIVNGGSTDCSPDIMHSYAVKDDRIVILSQSNRGVSAARNAGLGVAKGEYIFFVDSDDTIRKDAVEILYRQAVMTDVDIIIGNVCFCYSILPKVKFLPFGVYPNMENSLYPESSVFRN